MRYCPPIYVLCVSSHLWTVPRQIKFWAILIKCWDWRDPPPPCWDKIPSLPKKKVWTAPLSGYNSLHRNDDILAIVYHIKSSNGFIKMANLGKQNIQTSKHPQYCFTLFHWFKFLPLDKLTSVLLERILDLLWIYSQNSIFGCVWQLVME